MKVILDTNVFVSAIFWKGHSRNILQAWKEKELKLVLSAEIIDEYKRVSMVLSSRYKGLEILPIIELLAFNSEIYENNILKEKVCSDPDDDKFISCALYSKTKYIVSGYKHLLDQNGYRELQILKPKDFVIKILQNK